MAQQIAATDREAQGLISPGRYSETRAPQFVGGSIDPQTKNLSTGGADVNSTKPATPPMDTTPAVPKTRMGRMDVPKAPSMGQTIGGAAAGYGGAAVGSEVAKAMGGGAGFTDALGSAVSNPLKTLGGPIGLGGGATGGPVNAVVGATGPEVGSAVGKAAGGEAGAVFGGGAGNIAGSLAGGALAGVGTAIGGLISGQKPKEFLPAAIGSGVGFAIGNVVLPGIGGFVGSFLGGLFCHAAGTMVVMADNTLKPIETLKIGDKVMLGGFVLGRGEVVADNLYEYRGTKVNGRHAVLEDRAWKRIETSPLANKIEMTEPVMLYPVVTEHHLLLIRGDQEYVCADFVEVEADLGADERLAMLNADTQRTNYLQSYIAPEWSKRPYVAITDYPMTASWWKAFQDTDILPPDVLPSTGVVVNRLGKPAAVCFVYFFEAKIAWIAFPICAPDLPRLYRARALDLVLKYAVDLCHKQGVKVVWSCTENKAVTAALESVGLARATQHTHHYLILDQLVAPDMLTGDEDWQPGGRYADVRADAA